MQLTIFYDGYCPLCVMEMDKLKGLNKLGKLAFVDIQHADFSSAYPELEWNALNARIHAMREDGTLVTGLDATYEAWRAVGKGWVYAPLRWPIIRWFADRFYNFFARHRIRISYLLTGKKRPDQCAVDGACTPKTSYPASNSRK